MARDTDCFLAIVDALKATKQFDAVAYGMSVENAPVPSDKGRLAVVNPLSFKMVDQVDPPVLERQVTGSIVVAVREQSEEARMVQVDLLVDVVQAAVEGSSLGGNVMPDFTWISGGRYPDPTPPEQRCILQVEFRYLQSPGYGGEDVTDEFVPDWEE